MSASIIAVIGARSGSKSILHKNLKPLLGKPLIAWIIEAAKNSKHISRVILSTDSEDYAAIGRQLGVEVPFLRPTEISGDSATDYQYILHTLEYLQKTEKKTPDIVCRLIPTTPLTEATDIDATIDVLLKNQDADSSQLVTEIAQTPYKSYKLSDDGRFLQPLLPVTIGPTNAPIPRQMLPKVFVRANMIATRTSVVFNQKTLFGKNLGYHEVPMSRGIDIDHEYDFLLAEILLKRKLSPEQV
ncbi:MAG: acylneuraminate cytidylyltransferase family protein [Candidatus Omnitrophica bacterium]|nr:acylneuraminate cytidylyltransferase family protein [Candidatus Omnitrophota bacterium]